MPVAEDGVVLGFLSRVPDAGDELRVGYPNEPLVETGLSFTPPTVS